jgi:predicted Zn-dependent protease
LATVVAVSPRLRVWLVVGAAGVAAAGLAVGVTLATRSDVHRSTSQPPPFVPDATAPPGIVRDVREALRAWPVGTARRLRILAARYPHSALVRLELGLALAFTGQNADAARAWQSAERAQPDSPSAVRASDLRHPNTPPGLPPYVPSFARARTAVQRQLLQGAAFQQALRPVSAERQFAAAARAAPNDAEALTAAAVGLYDKDRPAAAFSRLGPLARRFPHAQTVRFHLGLLLIYFGDLPKARQELDLARAEGPKTPLGKRAEALLRAGQKS